MEKNELGTNTVRRESNNQEMHRNMGSLIGNGEAFELIDGENLEFKGQEV